MNYSEERYSGIGDGKILIFLIAGILSVFIGLYLGSKIHKNITPDVAGTYVGNSQYEFDDIVVNVSDEIICKNDKEKTASIVRTFEYEDHSAKGFVRIKSQEGHWKDKHRAFKLSFSDFEYISQFQPVNSKGRKIKAKKFMDFKIKILKRELTSDGASVLYKQNINGKREWTTHPFRRTKY